MWHLFILNLVDYISFFDVLGLSFYFPHQICLPTRLFSTSQCSKIHSKHLWHNTLTISLAYHYKHTNYHFGIKSNLGLSCPSLNFRFQNFWVIFWHLSWHFVLFLTSKHCFHCNFNIFVTKPFILCEKSAESRLSVCYYFAGVSHYYFEANGSNLI